MSARGTAVAAWLLAVAAGGIEPAGGAETARPAKLPLHEPVQITAEAEPIADAAVSPGGRWLVYAAGAEGSRDLWLRSADPAVVVLPRRLTSAPGDERAPVFAPDGRRIAYVGTSEDAKGDVYVLGLDEDGGVAGEPARLTGRETEDGAPAFSADGATVFFQTAAPGDLHPSLAAIDLRTRRVRRLDAGGDGAVPAVSPDGAKLVFVSYRVDPGGDLFLLDLSSGEVGALTAGPARDSAPAFTPDGAVVFSRRVLDTDGDGWVTGRDNGVLCWIAAAAPEADRRVHPLTASSYSADQPRLAARAGTMTLFFLSERSGVANVWSLPREGEIPHLDTAEAQTALAATMSSRLPPDPALAVVAWEKVIERFPRAEPLAARAALEVGRLFVAMGMPDAADQAFRRVADDHAGVVPEAALARIQLAGLGARREAGADAAPALASALGRLDGIAAAHRDAAIVQARAGIERARLLLDLGRDADSVTRAIGELDRVVGAYASERTEAAEAMVLGADAYARVGQGEQVQSAYLAVLDRYGEVEPWADTAVARVLDLTTTGLGQDRLDDRLQILRRLATENRSRRPRLAMGALNRTADLLFAANEWARAKATYRQVLDESPDVTTQTAAARLALAEILYREERFRQALDLYETELHVRPTEDRIYRLARRGYIRKTVAAGDSLLRLGENAAARSLFKELLRYLEGGDAVAGDAREPGRGTLPPDADAVVEAHRGYIRAAAALGDVRKVLAEYRARLAVRPDDPLSLYPTALCLTYLDGRAALEEAHGLLVRAIGRQGQVEYFHQTLGYVLEVLETVHGRKGSLELALESYRRAYFLNQQGDNPANAANLLLNLGNVSFALGQYATAFQFWTERLDRPEPFDSEDTEILFYRRFGMAAFQVQEPARTVELFEKAVALVRARTDPKGASQAYDALIRAVLDRVAPPATADATRTSDPRRLEDARAIAADQSALRARLFELTQADVPAAPSPPFEVYRRGIEELLSRQIEVNRRTVAFVRGADGAEADKLGATLDRLAGRAREALRSPTRFVELEAELDDRLALAYQEAGRWDRAADAFDQVFALNQRLGHVQNLARSRRGAAYSRYQLAGERTGSERTRLLESAARGFREAIHLVRRHGVPSREEAPASGALIGLTIQSRGQVAATETTRAAFGFTAEQEVRLAETFLGRIALEVGDLGAAGHALRGELARYPAGRAIAEDDLYGVALLYHRAGLLAFARGDLAASFEHFRRSAELSRQIGSAASTALTVANMARAVGELDPDDPARATLAPELDAADRETSRLIDRDPTVSRQPVAAFYHNALGIYWLAGRPRGGIEAEVARVRALERAASHFHAGLRALGDPARLGDRESLALAAQLHLGLARLAADLGEPGTADLEEALRLADRGFLPDLRWRALAGLGRHDEALTALELTSPLRAHAAPGEITSALAPLVGALVSRGDVEGAFDLAERLSELERVHRLAPLAIGKLPEGERALYRAGYPRVLRIRELRAAAAAATGEEKRYRAESLERERKLLAETLGKQRERLPALAGAAAGEERQDAVLILLGLAIHAETVADAAARALDRDEVARRLDEYRTLQQRYESVRDAAVRARPDGAPPGVLALLGAEPAPAADVQANLPEGRRLLRLFGPDEGGGFLVFTLTADDLSARRIASLAEISRPAPDTVLVHDDPDTLRALGGGAGALSATHWLRSFQGRKPFKRLLVAVPGLAALSTSGGAPAAPPDTPHRPPAAPGPSAPDTPAPAEPAAKAPEGFDEMPLATDALPAAIVEALGHAHTVVLQGRVRVAASVPTRAGETPERAQVVELPGGRLVLSRLIERLPRVSLAVLSGTAPDSTYPVAHLFSLAGCPSVLLTEAEAPGSSAGLLEAYASATAVEAAAAAPPSGGRWLLVGDRGLSSDEARALAQARFIEYVTAAKSALQDGRPLDALARAEDALLTAEETPNLAKHVAELTRFAREAAWAGGRLDLAERYAEALATRLERERPDSEDHADALLRLGLVRARLERYDRAVAALEQAQDMLANLELGAEQARALASLGVVLENATEYDRALTTFESAARASQAADQQSLLAAQHANLGRLLDLRLSQWARARQSYDRARALYEQIGDAHAVIQSLLDGGRCARLLGNFPEADRAYAQALALLARAPDEILRAKIVIEQANNAWFQGRYQEAFDGQRTAYGLALQSGWVLGEVIALNTSGLTWWTLGDNERALRELRKALELAESVEGRPDEVATTLNNIGLVEREMGRWEAALDTLGRALAIDRRLKSRWAVAYDLRNIGLTVLRKGDAEASLPYLREAAAEAAAIGDRVNEAKARLALGEALLAAAQATEAGPEFEKALELSRRMALRETEWRALYGQAQLALRAGARDEARIRLEEAMGVIEALRAAIKLEQLRDGFLTNKLAVYETLVSLLVDLGQTSAAFEVAERSRARNFIDLLGTQRLSLRGAVDRALYDRERLLKARIDEQQALVAQAATDGERAAYRDALQRLADEHRDLLLEIQAKYPELAALVSVEPVRAERVRALLDPGVTLVAYYLLGGEILCWVVKSDGITLLRTPARRDALARAVFDFRRLIQNLEPADAQSRELHRLLVEPALPLMRGSRYVGIVPHGVLHYLSFATLAGADSSLIDEVPLFYLPSASVFQYTRARRTREANRRVLAIGDPRLADPALALPFAEHEVGTIRWNFPDVTVLTGDRATETWVAKHVGDFGIIHLATHGEFDPINPLFSAVKLARDAENDGDLQAAEVFGLELRADLVVLSACQTAVGRVTGGDDVLGLNRAFFYAGTHAIVSSLWRVSDSATAMLMKHFYREHVGRSKADSLRAAILHVKRRLPHPGYWGAFVLAGDYE